MQRVKNISDLFKINMHSCLVSSTMQIKFYGLRQNPCKVTGRIGKRKSDDEVEFWTKEEYTSFIEKVKDKDISFYAFKILYWSGIRIGELRALTRLTLTLGKNNED